jgi:chromosome segregation ATPase
MWTDSAQFAAACSVITGAIVAVITAAATRWAPAVIKYRQQLKAEQGQDADREEKGYLFVIAQITKSRDELIAKCDKYQDQLMAAVQEREFLKGQDREKTLRIEMLEKESTEQHEVIKELRQRLHQLSNSVDVVVRKQAVAEKEAELKQNGNLPPTSPPPTS